MLGDIFGDIFGDMGFGFGGGSRRGGRPKFRGGDLRMKIRLNLQEVASGVTKKFKVHKNVTCPECQGSGCEKGHDPETCPNCNGKGKIAGGESIKIPLWWEPADKVTFGPEGRFVR